MFSIEYLYQIRDKFSSVLNKMAGVAKKFDSGVTGIQKGLGKLEQKFKGAGSKLANFQTGLAALGAGVFIKGALKDSVQFGDNIGKIGTLIPGQVKRLESLKKTIMNVSLDAGKNLGDIAGGAFDVISAFGDMQGETEGRLKAVSNAAIAGGSSTSEALSLLSAVTKSYGDTSTKALQKASDLAFMTNVLGQTTFPEMAASMGKVLPLTAQLAVSQEEVFASMATLTGVTGNTAEVSTQLAAIMSALIKPTEVMKDTIDRLGFSSVSAMVKEKGLADSLGELAKVTNGSEEAVGQLFGSKEAMTAFFALTGAQADKFSDSLTQMGEAAKSGGKTTEQALNEMTKIPGFELKKMTTQFEVLKIAIGDIVADALVPLAQKIKPFIDKVQTANPELLKMITYFLMGVTAIGAILVPLGLLLSSISTVIGAVKMIIGLTKVWTAVQAVWNAVMAIGLAPLLAIIGIIAAVIAISVLLYKNWDTVSAFLITVWENIKLAGTAAWDGIKTAFTSSIDFIKSTFFTFADIILSTYGNIFKKIIGLASKVGGAFGADVSGLNAMMDRMEDLQASVREKSIIGGITSPYAASSEEAPIGGNMGGANANANATVSVYTEKGLGVVPFSPSGDRGYQMQQTEKRAM